MANPALFKTKRDRHARGLKGPVIPHSMPIYENSTMVFERLLFNATEDFNFRLGNTLSNISISLEEIPNFRDLKLSEQVVPLGRIDRGNPNQVVIYQRPIEMRCQTQFELDRKIRDVMAELIGLLIGLRPIDIDPDYAGNN